MEMIAKINSVKVQGTEAKKNLTQLTNELLRDIQISIECDYEIKVQNVGSFHYALRVLNYQLMDIEDDGKPIILVLSEDDDSLEIHNLYYGYSLLIPSKYKRLVKKLSYPI